MTGVLLLLLFYLNHKMKKANERKFMAMRKGKNHETVSMNVKDMVRGGREPKNAIAMALMSARKYKDMDGYTEGEEEAMDANIPIYPIGDDQGLSENVLAEQKMASMLQADRYAANQNTRESPKNTGTNPGTEGPQKGLHQENDPMGSKPTQEQVSSTGEPMSVEAMAAIAERKKKRQMMY